MYERILAAATGALWLIDPAKLDAILALLELRCRGERVTPEVAAGYADAARPPETRMAGQIAVIPVLGTITQRTRPLMESSGVASTDRIGRQCAAALADPAVSAIVLDIDSFGGTAAGVPELADRIYAARGAKPIVAVANSFAASAAYWIGSAAKELVVTPSGEAGSIGVVAVHWDRTEANAQEGIRPTYVTYGRHKAEFNPDAPLSDASRTELQRRVDELGEMFVAAVARHRGVSPATVRSEYGEGRSFGAKDAKARGMVDRVETLEQTLQRLQDQIDRRRSLDRKK